MSSAKLRTKGHFTVISSPMCIRLDISTLYTGSKLERNNYYLRAFEDVVSNLKDGFRELILEDEIVLPYEILQLPAIVWVIP